MCNALFWLRMPLLLDVEEKKNIKLVTALYSSIFIFLIMLLFFLIKQQQHECIMQARRYLNNNLFLNPSFAIYLKIHELFFPGASLIVLDPLTLQYAQFDMISIWLWLKGYFHLKVGVLHIWWTVQFKLWLKEVEFY